MLLLDLVPIWWLFCGPATIECFLLYTLPAVAMSVNREQPATEWIAHCEVGLCTERTSHHNVMVAQQAIWHLQHQTALAVNALLATQHALLHARFHFRLARPSLLQMM